MNCAQHPQAPATGYCQNCGKALCPLCTRGADGLLLCEPCLHLRHPEASFSGTAAANPAYGTVPFTPVAGAYIQVPGAEVPLYRGRPSPALAGLLGIIPGVGAMYNGQFIKALIHVAIFIVLVGAASRYEMAGLMIAAWVFYQVFEAAQTAAARRDGLPLPDPFGILEVSRRMGPQSAYVPPVAPIYTPPPAAPDPVHTMGSGVVPAPVTARRGEPIGALVLIAVGTLLLLSTLGVFDVDWVGRGWPVLLILLGGWLLQRRMREGQAVPAQAAPSGERRNPFSITPEPSDAPSAAREEDPR